MGLLSRLFNGKSHDEKLKQDAITMEDIANANNSINYSSSEFNFVVEDVFSITGRGTIVTGNVISGSVKVNDGVLINGVTPTVISGIEVFRKMQNAASEGDNCGLLLKSISKDQVKRGDVLTKK